MKKMKVDGIETEIPENTIALQAWRIKDGAKIFGRVSKFVDGHLEPIEGKKLSDIKTEMIREKVRASLSITDKRIEGNLFLRSLRATPFKS